MPPKRKAPAPGGSVKAGKVSEMSTPGLATPRLTDSEEDDGFDEGIEEIQREKEKTLGMEADRFVNKWDLQGQSSYRKDAMSALFKGRDFSYLQYKPDHHNRPLLINPESGVILLERFNPLADRAVDFLITIAEPVSRPTYIHEYKLTTHSLYAAVSIGLQPKDMMNTLERFLKTPLPDKIRDFILQCTKSYGKVKLVLNNNKYFVESVDAQLLQTLLKDSKIGPLRIQGSTMITTTAAPTMGTLVIPGTKNAAGVNEAAFQQSQQKSGDQDKQSTDLYSALNDDDEDELEAVHSFQIRDEGVEDVQQRCLELGYPILEEYDFRNDDVNANLEIDLKPNTQVRSYQEKSLSKMFGNGRSKSGIIVLPCGAGKTLVGITAACTIRKGVVVLCTSSMSVVQWRNEFLKWSNIKPEDIAIFTSENKDKFEGNTGIIVTTYSMVSNGRERAHDSKKMMDFLKGREWGLMLLDEVHVVPAEVFRRVISSIKSHSKLGLTATLVREDDKISDLNFLIGPKLYEANWMELSEQGHIAKVQCAEVWCPMPTEFYDEYLRSTSARKRTICAMNPRKFQACQYLINYHEARGDKIIVFSDELYSLKSYAQRLKKFFIFGGTSQQERLVVLNQFQHNPEVNTLFLSKIGDTSLDLPEATVLIQISSHFGSRRQEAQRLGRILRAKRRNDEGFNAFFYTLVSKDTQEMYYASKRQTFLVDQGYAFKVITALANLENTPGLAFATPQERRELLATVLTDLEKERNLQQDVRTDSLFDAPTRGRKKGGVRRAAGTLGELSGGKDMAYMEQNKSANRTLKAKKGPQSEFFRKIQREKDRTKKARGE